MFQGLGYFRLLGSGFGVEGLGFRAPIRPQLLEAHG